MMRLVTANLNYSSWSMRAWLALKLAGAEFKLFDVGLKTRPDYRDRILSFSGAGKVPVLVDGALSIHESLAICEFVAERFPEVELWPRDPALRARGRAISCEMLSGFSQLRQLMPCNLRGRAASAPDNPELRREIARVFEIWQASLATSSGDFLLGSRMSIADCMYMPVLSRFRTFGVALPEPLRAYSDTVFSQPVVRQLDELAESTEAIPEYDAALG